MNYKLVLKTYAQLRQLTDDETALLNTLRGMSESERELLAETLGPVVKAKSAKTKTTRVIEKCGVCDYTRRAVHHREGHKDYHEFQSSKPKSARASSIAEKIAGTVGKPPDVETFNMDDLCKCGHMVDNNVHHKTSDPEYHPFESSMSEAQAASGG